MAEKEYIEREATLNTLRNLGSRDYRREKGTIADAIKMIMHPHYTPSCDVVEVVRCKDCAYANENGTTCHYGVGHYTSPMRYCSEGERKDGADNE